MRREDEGGPVSVVETGTVGQGREDYGGLVWPSCKHTDSQAPGAGVSRSTFGTICYIIFALFRPNRGKEVIQRETNETVRCAL